MEKHSYTQNIAYHALFLKRQDGKITILIIYVDDICKIKYGIFQSQWKYVIDLLKETSMFGFQPIDTPIEQNHGL
ncbi:hypothetical protein CR513_15774, partial [Mucuna pruriens]